MRIRDYCDRKKKEWSNDSKDLNPHIDHLWKVSDEVVKESEELRWIT